MLAYSDMYLDDAMCNLADMLDYAVYTLGYDIDYFYNIFVNTKIASNFEIGNPKYVTGMSGIELAWEVIYEVTGQYIYTKPIRTIDRTKEYWTGWVLAYYQHQRNMTFKRMVELGLTASEVCKRYILHEADLSKFMDVADGIVKANEEQAINRLKRLRKYAQLTQKELSERSGVTLRMIQLYEQGQNDLSKAQVGVVVSLAQALKCDVKDLL